MWMETNIVTSHIVAINTQPSFKPRWIRFSQSAWPFILPGCFEGRLIQLVEELHRHLPYSRLPSTPLLRGTCVGQQKWVFSDSAAIFKGPGLPGNGYFVTFGWFWWGAGRLYKHWGHTGAKGQQEGWQSWSPHDIYKKNKTKQQSSLNDPAVGHPVHPSAQSTLDAGGICHF